MSTILLRLDPAALSPADLAEIDRLAPEMELVVTQKQAEIERVLASVEIAAGHFPITLIPRAPRLRWLQQWGAGADWLRQHPEIAARDFILTSGSGVHAVPISEHIFAFLFAFARCLPAAWRHQAQRSWQAAGWHEIFELAGKTMLLIGVGAIGTRTAQVATALGMEVLGVRRDPAAEVPGIAEMASPDRLLELLPRADFVVLTIPLTAETTGLIGEQELRAMRPTAYIVNIGRGGTIQEEALIRALEEGRIAGAGLDVSETEPLPPSSPLWAMENVIITAHYAGRTPRYDERALAIFLDNLGRYRAGRPLRNQVDKTLGY